MSKITSIILSIKKKIHKIIRHMTAIKLIAAVSSGSLIALGLSIACDRRADTSVFYLLTKICPVNKENLVAAFNVLWPVAITVTIFILEFSEEYKYGVPLKRIVYEALGSFWLFVNVVFFLILFPLFYIFMKLNFMQMGLWCLCAAFIMFSETIAFFAWMYKGKHIRNVIKAKTLEQILDTAQKESKFKNKRGDRIQLHATIDSFAISDMLDHTDYGNADEVSGLANMCKGIFHSRHFWKKLRESTLENLMITTWADHIIHSCTWDTEYDCTQNINNLHSLWNVIMSSIPKGDADADKTEMSVCVQFLQPFVNENNDKNDKILERVWMGFGIYRKQTLLYLLLYTAYRAYRLESVHFSWMLRHESAFRICMQEIVNGLFWWDEAFAMQCWIDWSRYDCRNDIDLTQLIRFSDDMKKLQRGKRYEIKTPTLIQIIEGAQ